MIKSGVNVKIHSMRPKEVLPPFEGEYTDEQASLDAKALSGKFAGEVLNYKILVELENLLMDARPGITFELYYSEGDSIAISWNKQQNLDEYIAYLTKFAQDNPEARQLPVKFYSREEGLTDAGTRYATPIIRDTQILLFEG